MKTTARPGISLLLGAAVLCSYGCPGILPDGSDGSATPAPCSSGDDCPEDIACIFPNGMDEPGFCDVEETQVTSGVPAPCVLDEDCPDGVSCIFPNGTDLPGICDIEELQGP